MFRSCYYVVMLRSHGNMDYVVGYAQKSWEHGCYIFSLYIFSNKEVVSRSPKIYQKLNYKLVSELSS